MMRAALFIIILTQEAAVYFHFLFHDLAQFDIGGRRLVMSEHEHFAAGADHVDGRHKETDRQLPRSGLPPSPLVSSRQMALRSSLGGIDYARCANFEAPFHAVLMRFGDDDLGRAVGLCECNKELTDRSRANYADSLARLNL